MKNDPSKQKIRTPEGGTRQISVAPVGSVSWQVGEDGQVAVAIVSEAGYHDEARALAAVALVAERYLNILIHHMTIYPSYDPPDVLAVVMRVAKEGLGQDPKHDPERWAKESDDASLS